MTSTRPSRGDRVTEEFPARSGINEASGEGDGIEGATVGDEELASLEVGEVGQTVRISECVVVCGQAEVALAIE